MKDFINVDTEGKPDIKHNLNNFPYPFKDNSIKEINMGHVIEHLDDVFKVMDELHRICKNKAEIIIRVPYYNSVLAWADPTHKRAICEYTFHAFIDSPANYRNKILFKLKNIEYEPTGTGKRIPKFLLKRLCHVFGNIVMSLIFELEVIK